MPRPISNPRGNKKIVDAEKKRSLGKLPKSTEDDPLFDAMAGVLYLTTNSDKPEVKELAKRAHIDLSGFNSPVGPAFSDFSDSIKALVCMGLDTDENLKLMFGDPKSVRNVQQEIRMGLLFGAAPDSGNSSSSNRTDSEKPATADIIKSLPHWQRSLTSCEKDDHCSICQEKLVSPAQALHGCMHLFHPRCILAWLKKTSTCPVCKTALPVHAPRPVSSQELEQIDLMSSVK